MPFVPQVDGYLAQITLTCDHCDEEVVGAAGLPGAQRSLRELLEMNDALRGDSGDENLPLCPECEEPDRAFTLQSIGYVFEEGHELVLEETSMHINGDAVETEEDIMAAIGRPFSVVDWHRLQITPAFEQACVYPVEDGQVVVAMHLTDDDRAAIEREDDAVIDAMGQRLVGAAAPLLAVQQIAPADAHLVLWTGAQQTGVQRWLGPRSQDLVAGRLMVATVFDRARVLEAFADAFRRVAPDLVFDAETVSVHHREHEDLELPELHLDAHGVICVSDGMTLAEAATLLSYRVFQTFACALVLQNTAVEAGKQVSWSTGLQATVRDEDVTRTLDVNGLAAQLSYDTDAFAEAVLRDMSDPASACDCEHVEGLVVRPTGGAPGTGWPLAEGVAAYPVMDCEHFTVYVPGTDVDPEDTGWWQERLERAKAMSFHAFTAALPASQAMLVAGHNISSIFAQPALGAGLLAAVKGSFTPNPDQTPVAVAMSVDIALILADPSTDQELLQAEMLQYRRMLEQSPFALAAPLPQMALGLPVDEPAGEWTVTPLQV